jgi:DMSO/TMAO reductase YedYZ molybdopterin-dependent catalytic subunit
MADPGQAISTRGAGVAAGVVGAGVALLGSALVHTLFPRVPFPPLAVADTVVELTPGAVATFFIETLQHLALPLSVVVTATAFVALSALLGLAMPSLAPRVGPLGAAWILALPPFALAITGYRPDGLDVSRAGAALALLPVLVFAAWAAGGTYRRLALAPEPTSSLAPDPERRALVRGLALGAGGLVLGWAGLGRLLRRRPNPGDRPLHLATVTPAPLPSPAAGDAAFESIPGLGPQITPLGSFYLVDEEFIDPDVDPDAWTLRVDGLVERPYTLTYAELTAMAAVERFVTLECISNTVGGDLISTARWTGIALRDLLERAGVRPGAVEVVATAIGGYSDSITVEQAMGDALVAIGMNGRVLPREHGFPARLLVPGLYGMKQPKWLERLEVVDRPHAGYWETRGWSKTAVVRTMSRIDAATLLPTGEHVAAGVAFAGARGISRVEVSTDDGATWQEAELRTALANETWRQWRFSLGTTVSEGVRVRVRAVDGDGAVQVGRPQDPHPSGATGYDEATLDGA